MPKVSIVIPVYNEVRTIQEIIARVQEVPLAGVAKEIIVVDDFSKDGTREKLATIKGNNIKVFFHEKNMGKGAALRSGFPSVTGDYVIIQDADLECDPNDYPLLLKPLLENNAEVVYGSRFLGDRPHQVVSFKNFFANKFLTLLSNIFTNLTLTDMETCYKAFKSEILKRITLKENRFGFEPEFTARVAKLKVRIFEVGISYNVRTYDEGKKINWKDGLAAIWYILKYNLFAK